MALPIKETPVLRGKDATRFIKKMHDAETRPLTPKEFEEYKRAKRVYEEVNAAMRARGQDPNEFF
jgi:hypothetical protein